MPKLIHITFVGIFALALCFAVGAQKSVQTGVGDGGSPHYKTEWDIKGAHITIDYGRPYLKGRPIGKDVATYGEPWRTGADEATIITSTKALKIGTIPLAANTTYTINTLPNADHWDLIIGKLSEKGQWGIPYQPSLEIARTPMKLGKSAAPAEQVTITIEPSATGGTLQIEWGTVSASVPLAVS